jgi:hemerythrin superfamily protein
MKRKTTPNPKTGSAKQASKAKDAIALLKADHREVGGLFKRLEKTRSATRKKDLASQICIGLSVHMRMEEDIFYPAVKRALKEKDKELVPEARVEHASLKRLITEVETAELDEDFDARMQVMGEYVKHHVKEEETEMFPKARGAGVDMKELGARLERAKQELLAELESDAKGHQKGPRAPLPSSVFGEPAAQPQRA